MKSTVLRQDSWTEKEDALLAETVLKFIAEGSTQLKAFELVGEQVQRTPQACGFRWNGQIRQNYIEQVKVAKQQRIKLKFKTRTLIPVELEVATSVESIPTNEGISAHKLQQEIHELKQYINTIQNTQMKDLHRQIIKLTKERDDQHQRANKYQSLFHRTLQMSKIYSEIEAIEGK